MAMNMATGAMGSLLPKLAELLKDEYKLQKGVKKGIKSLEQEMKSMQAALRKVGEVSRDQLDEQVKLWAGEVRELSFDMEDIVDKFLVRVDDDSDTATKSNTLKGLTKKMAGLFAKGKSRHKIAEAIKEINMQVQEVAQRRERYNVDNIVTMPAAIDPRLGALYKEVTDLVGIAGKRDQELMRLLSDGDSVSKQKFKIVSVVGFGGLGKTTLVKTIYDKIKGDFDCSAFVPVGRNADAKKVIMDILIDLRKYESQFTDLDIRQLINILRESLENKRYLIVIDDIWDEELWRVINWAFSGSNNFGSRLITTTRIVSVSNLCCSSTNDSVYQMEPLSEEDSKRLFYTRIFSNESGCPREFEEVSKDILKKCGGVPLAIITIASLLASKQHVKTVDEWHVLLESIGRGLTEDRSVKEMLQILSFSYYDLPSHLKTCLSYLSMFPEDYMITKDQLIWMWIAEGFVQCEKAKISLFEIGETYFYELLNRNMILPVYDHDGMVVACNVHDMVLDLILSLSSEENFVTVVNGTGDSISSQRNIRRLSLQDATKGTHLETPSLLKVRSVASFGDGIDIMPSFSRFVVLRVLDLSGCPLGDHDHLNLRDLGSILQLRYLCLASTGVSKIPEEFGKLQFLQVLDLRRNHNVELPSTVIKLRKLMCLLIDSDHARLPDGLRNLVSMEVLGKIRPGCDSLSIVEDLGNMEGLRELRIVFDDLSLELQKVFVESLGKLSSIQILFMDDAAGDTQARDLLWERWMPPRSLQIFRCIRIRFPALPAWIRRDPSHMSQLSKLYISVKESRQEDLDILGRLPALRYLALEIQRWSGLLLVGADGFRCLISFELRSKSPGQIVFQPGAMPKAERVLLRVGLRVINEEAARERGGCFDLGMRNLLSLQRAFVWLENALRAHPNHPWVSTHIHPPIRAGAHDDDVLPDPEEEE